MLWFENRKEKQEGAEKCSPLDRILFYVPVLFFRVAALNLE
jgi:hypothetical protein